MSEQKILIAELVDRFGQMPDPVRNLLMVIELKQLCRIANVEKIDAGPKGLSLSFREHHFARPEKLIGWIAGQAGRVSCDPITACRANTLPKPEMQPDACNQFCKNLWGFFDVRPCGADLWIY